MQCHIAGCVNLKNEKSLLKLFLKFNCHCKVNFDMSSYNLDMQIFGTLPTYNLFMILYNTRILCERKISNSLVLSTYDSDLHLQWPLHLQLQFCVFFLLAIQQKKTEAFSPFLPPSCPNCLHQDKNLEDNMHDSINKWIIGCIEARILETRLQIFVTLIRTFVEHL